MKGLTYRLFSNFRIGWLPKIICLLLAPAQSVASPPKAAPTSVLGVEMSTLSAGELCDEIYQQAAPCIREPAYMVQYPRSYKGILGPSALSRKSYASQLQQGIWPTSAPERLHASYLTGYMGGSGLTPTVQGFVRQTKSFADLLRVSFCDP